MKLYCVYRRGGRAPVLVPQGFSFFAFLFGPLWLLFHAAFLPAAFAVMFLSVLQGGFGAYAGPAVFCLALATGIFGNELRGWSLRLRGFELSHIVGGSKHDAAYARLLQVHPEYIRDAPL